MRRLTHGTERCGRGALRVTALLTLLTALFVAPATAGAATAGGLKQLSGTNGCLSGLDPVPAGCREVRALEDLGDIVVAPDGENAYATARTNDAIVVFDRNTSTGVLTQKGGILGCLTVRADIAAAQTCNLLASAPTLDGPNALVVSADNLNVYVVTTSGRITSFNRAGDGSLTFNDASFFTASGSLEAVAISSGGTSVYMAGTGTGVGWYRRNTTPGPTLGDIDDCCGQPDEGYQACFGGPCSAVNNYGDVTSLEVTPDSKALLVGSSNSTLLGWDRTTGTGALTPNTTADQCVSNSASGTCQGRQGIVNVQSLAVVDNTKIHIGSQQSISTVTRNATTNALTPDAAGNCFGYPTSPFANCTPMPGGSPFVWYPAKSLVGSPDGKNLYLGTEGTTTQGVFSYHRSSGNISRNTSAVGCVNVSATEGCGAFVNGNRIQAMAATSNNRHVYAVGDNKLFSFAVDRPPVCQNVSAGTVNNASVTVTFNCSDPDGDPLTFEKVTDPARGTLAGISGNGVSYGPQPGTTGVDSFQYLARGAGVASDPATASINVSAPATGGSGGGGGVGGGGTITTLSSTTSINSLGFKKFTKLLNLSVKNLPAGATVRVTCKTKKKKQQKKGCPYKSKRFTTSGARASLNLRKPFAKKRIPVGTKITITITAPGFLGKQIQYTVRAGKIPKSRVRCLSASGKAGSCA